MFSLFMRDVPHWAFAYAHTYPGQAQPKHHSRNGRREQRKIAFFARQRAKRNKNDC